MKPLLLAIAFFAVTTTALAQNEKYVQAMQTNITLFDTTRSVEGLAQLAHAFERIALAEKKQWLPYYYAALVQVNRGYNLLGGGMGGDPTVIDPIADKAEALISQADALNPNQSEVYVVKKMIYSLRFMVDPQSRYMQYGPQAQQALERAKKLNPENPRVYLLEGQDKFYTPEQFGGSKAEAKKLFEQALQKFDTFKPHTALDPAWGKGMTQYFISQASK